jgi:acetyl-CoA C-acetyltransferase
VTRPVYVLGGAQTDFARNWSRGSDEPLFAMLHSAVDDALDDAAVDVGDVQTAHVANLAGDLFAGQAHLNAMLPALRPEWSALPTSRHEAACASGSVAVLAAMAEIEAGRYDVALVVGVELMRNVPGTTAAELLGCAAWVGRESFEGQLPWPAQFARVADEVDRRYGLDDAHLRRITELNRENARRNPLAQTRDWTVDPAQLADDDAVNPVVAGRLRASDCGRLSDGSAAVVLASKEYAERWAQRTGRAPALLAGWGHHTGSLSLEDKLMGSAGSEYLFPHVRATITDAYRRAGIEGPAGLSAIELHDCFSITEYAVLDHFGLTSPGKSWQAIESGTIDFGGSLPVNPSGGLIGLGHPVGATGVRMLNDAARQVTGRAGATQVENASAVATLNIGGSLATAVSFVVTNLPS